MNKNSRVMILPFVEPAKKIWFGCTIQITMKMQNEKQTKFHYNLIFKEEGVSIKILMDRKFVIS